MPHLILSTIEGNKYNSIIPVRKEEVHQPTVLSQQVARLRVEHRSMWTQDLFSFYYTILPSQHYIAAGTQN